MKNVFVTGGHGFLGKFVCKELKKRGYNVEAPSHQQLDLLDVMEVRKYMRTLDSSSSIIHLAALCGGIGMNKERPADLFYNNLMMGVQLMEEARWMSTGKFVAVGTVCAYPKFTVPPFKEDDLWNGYPEETNAPYGLAKKMLLVQAQAYRQQYALNAIYLLPVNLYGPGDNFNSKSSHVIPALIRKIDEAIETDNKMVEVWGTGMATREFLYVEDCAKGICDALEKYNSPEPMNLGTGLDITIRNLAKTIGNLMGFNGVFSWDTGKPNGQPARCLCTERAKLEMGWTAETSLTDGLKKTIEWWRQHGRD